MSSYKTLPTPGDTAWFTHDRFGMFIHFGLYAMPARHEWVKNHEEHPGRKLRQYFKHFNPDLFDAREWARQAKAAGMKYAVLTTKHHEGFCLFDSQYTDYKCTNTPCGQRSGTRICGCVPGRGAAGGLLLFPDRLASSGFPDRHAASPQRTIRTLMSRARAATCTSMPSTCAIR